MFQLLNDWRYIGFQTGHFDDFEQFKTGKNLPDFG